MLLFIILFSLYESALEEIKALVLESLDIIFAFVPLTNFLLLHQLTAESEASLI